MARATLVLAVLAVLTLAVPAPASAAQGPLPEEPLFSVELVEDPGRYDGEIIEFTGEAIGEAMRRGDMAWLHLNDDAYATFAFDEGAPLSGYNSGHAVWVSAGLAERVVLFGDNRHRGDLVRVRGVFNAACVEHGGDMDIHADTLEVVGSGAVVGDPVAPGKVRWALALSVAALGLYALTHNWETLFPDKVSPRA